MVSSDLRWVCEDSDGEGEALAWEDTNRTGQGERWSERLPAALIQARHPQTGKVRELRQGVCAPAGPMALTLFII